VLAKNGCKIGKITGYFTSAVTVAIGVGSICVILSQIFSSFSFFVEFWVGDPIAGDFWISFTGELDFTLSVLLSWFLVDAWAMDSIICVGGRGSEKVTRVRNGNTANFGTNSVVSRNLIRLGR